MNIFSSVTNAQYDHPGQKVPEYLTLLQEAHTLPEKVEVPEAEIRRLQKWPPRPDIKPNSKPSDDSDDSPGDPQATGQRLEWLRAIYDDLTGRLKATCLFLRPGRIIENASLLLACGLSGVTE